MTEEEKILINKLVRNENKTEIMDIVKKLVPESTEFTARLYAYHTEFIKVGWLDKFMDIEKKSDREKFLHEHRAEYGEEFFQDVLKFVPCIPLTDEDRLYRPKYLKFDAPEIKNKHLEGVAISNQEWQEMHPVERYIIRAMRDNPDFDWKSAEKFVLAETKKVLEDHRKNLEKGRKNSSKATEEENFLFHMLMETQFVKRENFFNQKLHPHMSDEEITGEGYERLLMHVQSVADPNYSVRSSISADFTFAKAVENYYNEEMRKKFGDDFEPEIFGETFMKTLDEIV